MIIQNNEGMNTDKLQNNETFIDLPKALEFLDDGIVVTSPENIIIYVNDAFIRLYGYERTELLGQNIEIVRVAKTSMQLINKFIADANQKTWRGELLNRKKDGSRIYINLCTSKIYDAGGNCTSIIGVARDITAQKIAEAKLLEAKNSAEESSQIKEQFLAHMSHEFRTPLNAIIGSTFLILSSKPDERHLNFIEAIRISADNLLSLVNNMLDFSKIREGKAEFHNSVFSLREIVRQVFHVSKIFADKKHIVLEYIIDPDVPSYVNGDPNRFNQILLNLISNGIKFTEAGKVKMLMHVYAIEQDRIIFKIDVSDTGIGIIEKDIDNIFDDFVQGANSLNLRRSGTGLGLSISRRLIELQGGSISVQSTVDKGSTFSVFIPFQKAAVENDTVSDTAEVINTKELINKKALVVEDNEFNQLIIKEMLHNRAVLFDVADDAKKALALMFHNQYDFVLMDIGLPDMAGYELTEYIRNDSSNPNRNVPILALTASASVDEKLKALNAGMNDYISKPFPESVLLRKIIGVLTSSDFVKSNSDVNRKLSDQYEFVFSGVYFKPKLLLGSKGITVSFLNEIIDAFIDNAPPALIELNSAFELNDWKSVKRIAHKTKSMFAYLHLKRAVKLLDLLENFKFSKGDFSKLQNYLIELNAMSGEIIEEMAAAKTTLKVYKND